MKKPPLSDATVDRGGLMPEDEVTETAGGAFSHDESHAFNADVQGVAISLEKESSPSLSSQSPLSPGIHGSLTPPSKETAPIIELTDLKSLARSERLKSSRLPLLLIGFSFILIIGALLFKGDQGTGDNRIRLLAPRKGQTELSEQKIKEKFKKALASFQSDTFTGYQRAQNELVEIIEGAPPQPEFAAKKAGMVSTLCLVYRELWPFAFQDSRDMKVLGGVAQEAKRLDPAGLNGALCEIVQMMLNGRYRDAQGLTENMLVDESQTPVLFEVRGDQYSYVRDFANAAIYFNQARTLWPAWQKTAVQEARARAEERQYPQAISLFRGVLAKVPEHPVAKVELALIEYSQFQQVDKALELLNSAIDGGERLPKPIEARALLGVAQIYMKRNQRSKALDFARRSYALNSASQAARDLIVQLAGADELKNAKVDGRELIYLGDQYVRAGDCFAAQAEYKAAFESEPKNAVAAMKAGKCLWRLNQSADAIEWMKKAIQADANLISAYTELADYYAQRFDYLSAVRVLQKVQQIAPRSYEVYRGFATVELRRNNYQGAVTFGQRSLKLYETDLDTFLIMIKAYIGLQNFQEAHRFAGKALELDSNNTEAQSLYGKVEAGLHGVDSGVQYIQQQINRYVITAGQQVPQAAIDLRVALGEIYMQDERFAPAEDALRQAISLDKDNKKALMNLGKVLLALNRPSSALEAYLKAAVLDPSDADPIFYSGQVYAEVGKFADAATQFDRVLKINSRYPRAHVQLGRTSLRLGNAKRALDEAMQEKAVNPELADGYLLAAEAYYELRQYSNCAAEYQRAVSKRAQGAIVLIRMARCYRLSGALESAQSLLRQAQAQESGIPDLYKEQGAIFQVKDMADEALTAYDTYLKLAPNAKDRPEVEANIRRIQSGASASGFGD